MTSGNTREINSPYYLSSEVLTKGFSDYDYGIGFIRSNFNRSMRGKTIERVNKGETIARIN